MLPTTIDWVWERLRQQDQGELDQELANLTATLDPTTLSALEDYNPFTGDQKVCQPIATFQNALCANNPSDLALIAVLLARHPKKLLTLLRNASEAPEGDSPPNKPEFRQLMALADICWTLTVDEDRWRTLRSRLARARFLLLSISIRDTPNGSSPNWREACRDAQQRWLECLDATEADPWLSERDGHDNEQDAKDLVFRTPSDREPLFTAVDQDGIWQRTLHDSGIARRVVDGHLLPRGALHTVLRLSIAHETPAAGTARRPTRAPRTPKWLRAVKAPVLNGLVATAPVLFAAATIALLLTPWSDAALRSKLALLPAVLCFMITTLIGLGTRPHNAIRSRLTLARIPASVIIGLATLLTLNPHWWTGTEGTTSLRITAIAMLLGAAIAYQAHELRGHGVTGRRLIRRTIGIVTIGLCYAFIISYATLRVIAPLITEDGNRLAGWWLHDPNAYHGAAPWWLLGLATAWSYTVGVFIQVVWDDRPITAPLGRMPRGNQ